MRKFMSWLKDLLAGYLASQQKSVRAPSPPPAPAPSVNPMPIPPVIAPVDPGGYPQGGGVSDITEPTAIWDGALVADWMRDRGWQGSQTQLCFALFSTYGNHIWGYKGDLTEDPVAVALYHAGPDIEAWFRGRVEGIGKMMLADPNFHVTLIINDANDLGGCFMWQPIRDQLIAMKCNPVQWTVGNIFTL